VVTDEFAGLFVDVEQVSRVVACQSEVGAICGDSYDMISMYDNRKLFGASVKS